jgi:hypothetical protein
MKAWLGNMLMSSIIAKYQGEEDVLFQMNCAQSFGHFKFISTYCYKLNFIYFDIDKFLSKLFKNEAT